MSVGGGDLVFLDLGARAPWPAFSAAACDRSLRSRLWMRGRTDSKSADAALAAIEDLDQVDAGLIEQIALDRSHQVAGLAGERGLLERGVVAAAAEEPELAAAILGGLVLRVLARQRGEVLAGGDAALEVLDRGLGRRRPPPGRRR